jgi:hypothetical protein
MITQSLAQNSMSPLMPALPQVPLVHAWSVADLVEAQSL